jgi:hypothetical protein
MKPTQISFRTIQGAAMKIRILKIKYILMPQNSRQYHNVTITNTFFKCGESQVLENESNK